MDDLAGKTRGLITHLRRIERTQSPAAFACSFGVEDMVLLDAIAENAPGIDGKIGSAYIRARKP